MIIILAYWLFLLSLFLPAGILVNKLLRIKTSSASLLIILGMFFMTVGFTVTAFVFPLGVAPLLFITLISLISAIAWHKDFTNAFKSIGNNFSKLPKFYKLLFAFLFTAILLRSAQSPFVIDNESYYIQTIKWLNEYGFVKGLGNLHIFFSQTSSWHVLQAGLNFNFITSRLNDINGFLFVVCLFYYLTEGYKELQSHNKSWLLLVPVFSGLLLFFTDAPSPDMPLLLLSPILLWLFTTKDDESHYRLAVLLFFFMAFIKITIVPLGLIFIIYAHKKPGRIYFFSLISISIGLLWIIKNIIISGYPLYPFTFLKTGYDWAIPSEIINHFNTIGVKDVYGVYNATSFTSKLSSWFFLKGLSGIFNKLIVLLFIIVPFFKIIRSNIKYKIVYITLLVHFIILLFTSPQFRFFLPEIFFFTALLLSELLTTFKERQYTLYKISLSVACVAVVFSFIALDTTSLTDNKHHQSARQIKLSQLYLPEENSKYPDMDFNKLTIGNMEYYSPKYNFFLYGTANGPLPCVNERQLHYISSKTGYIPQLRDKTLSDGFYSVNLPEE